MPMPMGVVGLGKVDAEVCPAGLLPLERRFDHQPATQSMFCNSQPVGSANCRGNT